MRMHYSGYMAAACVTLSAQRHTAACKYQQHDTQAAQSRPQAAMETHKVMSWMRYSPS